MSGRWQRGAGRRLAGWALAAMLLAGCGTVAREQSGGAPTQDPATLSMSATELKEFVTNHPDVLLLDVRNPDEWDGELGHIEGATLLPLPELESRLGEIAQWKEKPVIAICRSGNRSAQAQKILNQAGFKSVVNLRGGMRGWREAGY